MNEEIDESDFYHQDFTTASQWEIFMARMEEIINQWKHEDSKTDAPKETPNTWTIRSQKLRFVDVEFCLHSIRKSLETSENSESSERHTEDSEKPPELSSAFKHDFELYHESLDFEHSCLHTWYGVNDYIVLAPRTVEITCPSKIKILVSSAYIVANNLKCAKPIFVQIREKWQRCYLGVYENEEFRINYEMAHLKIMPSRSRYLGGLMQMFKEKLMPPMGWHSLVSLQHTYALQDFGRFYWKQDQMSGDTFDIETVFILPFGVTVDPVNTLFLKTTWNHRSSRSLVDEENHTHFVATSADKWSCMVKMTKEPTCLLEGALSEFLHILGNHSTVYNVLGDFVTLPTVENNPLDVLTEPAIPTISALLTRAARRSLSKNKRSSPPISESVLVSLLYFLFPDADENSNFPYNIEEDKELISKIDGIVFFFQKIFQNLEEEFKSFKTCGKDSLIWRLSIVLAHCLQSLGGLRAFAHIWYEFVQEMRYRWDKCMPIPG
nr:rab3 GTPase-activating protein catalytic subunit [Leptinotarsa decemlineata]